MSFVPSEHEKLSKLIPIAVSYQCELCNDGIMEADPNDPIVMEMTNPPRMQMRRHFCNKCNGMLMLPKTYPYVEWITPQEYSRLAQEYDITDSYKEG